MKTLDLNQVEQDTLGRILKRCLADLEHEIIHTHHAEFKKMLRERRDVLEGIIGKLSARAEVTA